MMNSNFIPEQFIQSNFKPLSEGNYRVRISQASLSEDNNGNTCLEIVFDISGKIRKLWYCICIDPDAGYITSQRLNNFFDSFGIRASEQDNFDSWIGKMGAVRVRPSDYYGKTIDKVIFCLDKGYQKRLPEWKEVLHNQKNRKR